MAAYPGLDVWASHTVCRTRYVNLWYFPWPKVRGARVLHLRWGFRRGGAQGKDVSARMMVDRAATLFMEGGVKDEGFTRGG